MIFSFQADTLWLTADDKPFISGEWNNRVPTNVELLWLQSSWDDKQLIISAFEPGRDGNRVAIVYMRETHPRWVILPHDAPLAFDWFCKNQPRTLNLPQRPVYPSRRCLEGCLLIDDMCHKYKLVPSVSNASMGCVDDQPYISYLNKYFVNRGINVIFTTRCGVIKEYEARVADIMRLQGDNVHYMSTYLKVFQLHKTDTNSPICDPTTQRCDDGSCRAQSIICVLDFECAPNMCSCTVDNQLRYDREYCHRQCPPRICTCAPLMFQCSIGGCIPYLHVCDKEYDCADSSDEFCVLHTLRKYHLGNKQSNVRFLSTKSLQLCFDFICSAGQCIDIHLVNDLIPDCSDASDEYHSLSIKYDGLLFRCSSVKEIPCIPGHSKCFGMHNLCLYDLDHYGHITYCRDGAHLLNCKLMKCTNSFKCPGSYCVPIRKVCDGVHDCGNGADEINCQNNICPGYLKCSGTEFCIHPTEVCDGYSHCPYGDDEKLCDIRGCPVGCTCSWHCLMCRDTRLTYIPEIPFQDVIYLSVGLNDEFGLTFANLSSLSRLIILDLSSSIIANICPALQENYRFYKTLNALYLQMNDMKYLSSFCFSRLPSLHVINLQGSHLINIANDAFKGVSLNVLILNNAVLSSPSGHWIDGFSVLKTLDKRGATFDYWSQTVVNGLEKIETIYTDDARLCCILHNIKDCHGPMQKRVKCFRLLSQSVVGRLLMFLAFANLIFIIITMGFVKTFFSLTRPVQFFLHNVILVSKSICVTYVFAIATVDMYIGNHYIFWNSMLSHKLVCQTLSISLSAGILMYNITVAFRDHIAYMAVSRMLFNENDIYSNAKKFVCMAYLLVVAGFGLLTFWHDEKINFQFPGHQFCTSPLGVSTFEYKWAAIRPVVLSSIILLSLTYSIFTNCAIYRKTYCSGKYIQTLASPERDIHQPRMSKLMKTLHQSTTFRCLECLPLLCIIISNLCSIYVSLDIQLALILISIICGSFITDIKQVWYPLFNKE